MTMKARMYNPENASPFVRFHHAGCEFEVCPVCHEHPAMVCGCVVEFRGLLPWRLAISRLLIQELPDGLRGCRKATN